MSEWIVIIGLVSWLVLVVAYRMSIRPRRNLPSWLVDRRALREYAEHGELQRAFREKTKGRHGFKWCVCDGCTRARAMLGTSVPPEGSINPPRYS